MNYEITNDKNEEMANGKRKYFQEDLGCNHPDDGRDKSLIKM